MSYNKTKKLEIIDYYYKHNFLRTIERYQISKSTLYRWLSLYRIDITNLENKSTRPKTLRKSKISPKITKFIDTISTQFPKTGRVKMKRWLDRFCKQQKIKSISSSTLYRYLRHKNKSNLY